jgi:hypothetical protein
MIGEVMLSATEARRRVLQVADSDFSGLNVRVHEDVIGAIRAPAEGFSLLDTTVPEEHPLSRMGPGAALSYYVAMNSINYQFWRLDGRQLVRYAFDGAVGSVGMRKAFDQLWGTGLNSNGLRARLAKESIETLFGDIPDPTGRYLSLIDSTQPEVTEFCEEVGQAIREGEPLTVAHAWTLAELAPSAYDDPYLKKAQLALAEFGAWARRKGYSVDVSQLTAFADYQVPRVLRALGVLEYSGHLANHIDDGKLIREQSEAEAEIRGATIFACELLAAHFRASPAEIDTWLWTQRNKAGSKPFHLTVTRRY